MSSLEVRMFRNSRNALRFNTSLFVALAAAMEEMVRDFHSVFYMTSDGYDMMHSWHAFRIAGVEDTVYMELDPTGGYPKEMVDRREEYPVMCISPVDAQSFVAVFDENGHRVDAVTMEYTSRLKYFIYTKIGYAVEVTSAEHVYVTRFDLTQHRWKKDRWNPDSGEEVRYYVQEAGQKYFLSLSNLINDMKGMLRLRELCATRESYAAIMTCLRSEEVVEFREAVEEAGRKEAEQREDQRRMYEERARVQRLVKGGMDRELAERHVKGSDHEANLIAAPPEDSQQVTFPAPNGKWTKCTCSCSVKLTSTQLTAWNAGQQIELVCSNGHSGIVTPHESA